jgi:hypothetical protein
MKGIADLASGRGTNLTATTLPLAMSLRAKVKAKEQLWP